MSTGGALGPSPVSKLGCTPYQVSIWDQIDGFFWHLVGGEWIAVNDENLEKICHARRPTMKREVRSFLGLANLLPQPHTIFCSNFCTIE